MPQLPTMGLPITADPSGDDDHDRRGRRDPAALGRSAAERPGAVRRPAGPGDPHPPHAAPADLPADRSRSPGSSTTCSRSPPRPRRSSSCSPAPTRSGRSRRSCSSGCRRAAPRATACSRRCAPAPSSASCPSRSTRTSPSPTTWTTTPSTGPRKELADFAAAFEVEGLRALRARGRRRLATPAPVRLRHHLTAAPDGDHVGAGPSPGRARPGRRPARAAAGHAALPGLAAVRRRPRQRAGRRHRLLRVLLHLPRARARVSPRSRSCWGAGRTCRSSWCSTSTRTSGPTVIGYHEGQAAWSTSTSSSSRTLLTTTGVDRRRDPGAHRARLDRRAARRHPGRVRASATRRTSSSSSCSTSCSSLAAGIAVLVSVVASIAVERRHRAGARRPRHRPERGRRLVA